MANHQGSAGALKVAETKNLRYVKFLAGGDSKSFPAVEDIYEG